MLIDDWNEVSKEFQALGGVLQNATLDSTDRGYGLVAVCPGKPAQIFCPKELLIDTDIFLGEYGLSTTAMTERKLTSAKVITISYLKAVFSEAEEKEDGVDSKIQTTFEVDRLLVEHGLPSLASRVAKDSAERLKIFVDRRAVKDGSRRVLAPIWDLINHSSFSAGYSRTKEGLLTSKTDTQEGEILHKYMPKASPLLLWQKYGFSDRCTSAFSFPFRVSVPGTSLQICCKGKMYGNGKFLINQKTVDVDMIVVGSISRGLVKHQLLKGLNDAGISAQQARELIILIIKYNIEKRLDLQRQLLLKTSDAEQLRHSLELELELLEHSAKHSQD